MSLIVTKAEIKVINLLSLGYYSSKSLSIELNLAVRTVDTHLYNIMQKNNIPNKELLLRKVLNKNECSIGSVNNENK